MFNLTERVEAVAVQLPFDKQRLLRQYPKVFRGLGEFPGEHHIHVDLQVTPVEHGCRRIPFAVME